MKRLPVYSFVVYVSWLGMLAIHESGHAIAGWISGGHVQRIVLPLWGFSRTDVSPNPHPVIEVWAGPVWGGIAPVIIWLTGWFISRKPLKLMRFFAGFCLIANGSYLAVGWTVHAGDAWELVRLGMPRWLLAIAGLTGFVSGLWIWHRLDPHHR